MDLLLPIFVWISTLDRNRILAGVFVTTLANTYNGDQEIENVEIKKIDEICAMIKDMELRKSIEFEHLLVFGDGNHDNYLHYSVISMYNC